MAELNLELNKETPYVLALSGGGDSVALFHYLQTNKYAFRCIHVAHGDSPADKHSSTIEAFCIDLCAKALVPLFVHRIDLANYDKSIGVEAFARNARYASFREQLHEKEVLLTGHHANDQAETVLFRLMRGMGVTGGCGIPCYTTEHGFPVYRPLLEVSKKQILDYLTKANQSYLDDECNYNEHYARSFLRHRVIPLLEDYFKDRFQTGLQAFIRNMNQSAQLELEVYLQDKHNCLACNSAIQVQLFKEFSAARQLNFMRHYLKEQSGQYPSFSFMTELLRRLDTATHHPVSFTGQGHTVCYSNKFIWLAKTKA